MLTTEDLNNMTLAAQACTQALRILASEMAEIDDKLLPQFHQRLIDLEETISQTSAKLPK